MKGRGGWWGESFVFVLNKGGEGRDGVGGGVDRVEVEDIKHVPQKYSQVYIALSCY